MQPDIKLPGGRTIVYRHPVAVRLVHWVNAVCILALLMSGLQILNAHPAFYWGETSSFSAPFLAFEQAVPSWALLPGWDDLGLGRRWHFFFAWILTISVCFYFLYAVLGGRLRAELLPRSSELRHLGQSLVEHLDVRKIRKGVGRRYNLLQKIAYLAILFGAFPLMILTGLAMSPAVNAALPWLTGILGGRQSARTLHFLCAASLVAFFLLHMLMVLAAGPLREVRAMVTGWLIVERAE
jgi:thiosulfate reductase cytochrome b subunit